MPAGAERDVSSVDKFTRAQRYVNPDWIADKRLLAELKETCLCLQSARDDWPRITVVTPSFNYAQFIPQTIASVQYQYYPNLEYIICDNFSEDGTQEILARNGWADIRIEKDSGQADALNRAFATANGDILSWLNADDFYAPLALFKVAWEFLKGGADLIAGQVILMNDEGPRAGHLYSLPDGPILRREILDLEGFWHSGQYFYQPEVFFTKEIYQRAGGRTDDSLYYSMDYDLWCRMAEAGATVRAMAQPVAFFREHEEQKTSDPNDFRSELRKYVASQNVGDEAAPRYQPFSWSIRRPRVAMINDLGFQYGAGIAHGRIAKAFGTLGAELKAFSMAVDVSQANHSDERDTLWLRDRLAEFAPDLIVLGNLHAAEADHDWLKGILETYPVFFVTHDFYWLTDGSPYPESAEERATTQTADSISEWIAHPNAYILANSEYTRIKAKEILLSHGFTPETLQTKLLRADLGFETSDYFLDNLTSRMATRVQHNLPQDKKIALFPSGNWQDKRKNAKAAVQLANLLDPDVFHVVFLGRLMNEEQEKLPDHASVFDFIRNGDALAALFRSADFVFSCAKDETFGQTVVEGALCGAVPVSVAGGAIPGIMSRMSVGHQAPVDMPLDAALDEIAGYMAVLISAEK